MITKWQATELKVLVGSLQDYCLEMAGDNIRTNAAIDMQYRLINERRAEIETFLNDLTGAI